MSKGNKFYTLFTFWHSEQDARETPSRTSVLSIKLIRIFEFRARKIVGELRAGNQLWNKSQND